MTTLPGFADPVHDAQACFRAALHAMSHPGQVARVSGVPAPPAPLSPACAAALLTLVDADSPVWLDDAALPARDWLVFHSGAAIVPRSDATFGVALALPPLDTLPAGTDEVPEGGATLLLQVAALGRGTPYRLSGPGLREPAILLVDGLPPGFARSWAANRARFPRGVDLLLCADDHLAALPRTTLVEEA